MARAFPSRRLPHRFHRKLVLTESEGLQVCRWHKADDVPGGRFLVPGCWSRVVGGDHADCQCPKPPKRLTKEARALVEALAALRLDDDQLDEAWAYLARFKSR